MSTLRPLRALARPTARTATQCLRTAPTRSITRRSNGLDTMNIDRMAKARANYNGRRKFIMWCGAITGAATSIVIANRLITELQKPTKMDAALPPGDPLAGDAGINRKVILHDEEGREIVPTNNSTVPFFPRTLDLGPDMSASGATQPTVPIAQESIPSVTSPTLVVPPAGQSTEYTLVGFGLRTVSFLSIQVYVVGYYVATADIAALQHRLVKKINPIASTLVAGEKEELRSTLLDPVKGEELWTELLKEGVPARSVFRVVPVRDTDFHHLRDGFVRAITARTKDEADGEALGEGVREFKKLMNRGKVPKKKELLLIRDKQGKLSVVYDDGRSMGRQNLGTVDSEVMSRALWLNYLAGKNVASEPARKSIVDGILEFVERPVGTVAAQVV